MDMDNKEIIVLAVWVKAQWYKYYLGLVKSVQRKEFGRGSWWKT